MHNEEYLLWYQFRDKAKTAIKTTLGKTKIIRKTFFTRKVVELQLENNEVLVVSNSFGKRKKLRELKDVFTRSNNLEEKNKLLKKVLLCESTNELQEKIRKGEILELTFLEIINDLFHKMFIF